MEEKYLFLDADGRTCTTPARIEIPHESWASRSTLGHPSTSAKPDAQDTQHGTAGEPNAKGKTTRGSDVEGQNSLAKRIWPDREPIAMPENNTRKKKVVELPSPTVVRGGPASLTVGYQSQLRIRNPWGPDFVFFSFSAVHE